METALFVLGGLFLVLLGGLGGYKVRERKLVSELKTAAKNEYIETATDLADFIDPEG